MARYDRRNLLAADQQSQRDCVLQPRLRVPAVARRRRKARATLGKRATNVQPQRGCGKLAGANRAPIRLCRPRALTRRFVHQLSKLADVKRAPIVPCRPGPLTRRPQPRPTISEFESAGSPCSVSLWFIHRPQAILTRSPGPDKARDVPLAKAACTNPHPLNLSSRFQLLSRTSIMRPVWAQMPESMLWQLGGLSR